MIKPWETQLRELLRNQYPGEEGAQLYERYVPLMPSHYRARVDTLEALENIQYMELLTHEDNLQFDLKQSHSTNSPKSESASIDTDETGSFGSDFDPDKWV